VCLCVTVDANEVRRLEEEAKKMGMRLLTGSADKGLGIGPVAVTIRSMVERLGKI
jgi:hypothetical protein